jgi:hypothetical protein
VNLSRERYKTYFIALGYIKTMSLNPPKSYYAFSITNHFGQATIKREHGRTAKVHGLPDSLSRPYTWMKSRATNSGCLIVYPQGHSVSRIFYPLFTTEKLFPTELASFALVPHNIAGYQKRAKR